MTNKDIKVLLVEDHMMIRMGTALVIEKTEGITLVGEAEDGQQGVEMAKELLPDVILMDIGLPVIDGIEATRRIKELNLDSKILIFTSRDNDDDVFAALAAGADGYIMKGATAQQLTAALTAVNEGTAWLDPAIARLVLSNVQKQKSEDTTTDSINYKAGKNTFGPHGKRDGSTCPYRRRIVKSGDCRKIIHNKSYCKSSCTQHFTKAVC